MREQLPPVVGVALERSQTAEDRGHGSLRQLGPGFARGGRAHASSASATGIGAVVQRLRLDRDASAPERNRRRHSAARRALAAAAELLVAAREPVDGAERELGPAEPAGIVPPLAGSSISRHQRSATLRRARGRRGSRPRRARSPRRGPGCSSSWLAVASRAALASASSASSGRSLQPERDRSLPLQLGPAACRGEQRDGSAEQADRRRDVVRPPDAHARFAEALARRRRELVGVLAELAPVVRRLLEVVADQGVVAGAVAVEPRSRALVQRRAVGLRQRRVGGVAEEDVVEAVAVVAPLGGAAGWTKLRRESDESAASTGLLGERRHDAARELASDDRGALEHCALGRRAGRAGRRAPPRASAAGRRRPRLRTRRAARRTARSPRRARRSAPASPRRAPRLAPRARARPRRRAGRERSRRQAERAPDAPG